GSRSCSRRGWRCSRRAPSATTRSWCAIPSRIEDASEGEVESDRAGIHRIIAGEGAVIAQEELAGRHYRQAETGTDDGSVAIWACTLDSEAGIGCSDEASRDGARRIGEIATPSLPP